jgi:hypothetical protein
MKLLQSLEDLLYEVIVWLVFYPKTLWLSLRYPQSMMDYADTELGDVQSAQYTDMLSPPLFLMLSLAISHGIGLAFNVDVPHAQTPQLLTDSEHLLIFRVMVFSFFPLAMSLRLLLGLRLQLDREALRAPFYSQCYVTAPFALAFGLAYTLGHIARPHSAAFASIGFTLATVWYVRQQAEWFAAKLGTSTLRSWATAITTFVGGVVAILLAAAVVALDGKVIG